MQRSTFYYSYNDRRILKRNILCSVLGFVLAMLLFYAVAGYLMRPVMLRNESMHPTMNKNDYYFVLQAGVKKNIEAAVTDGDTSRFRGAPVLVGLIQPPELSGLSHVLDRVVGFATFQRFFPYDNSQKSCYVRRLVAFPGDEIYMDNFVLYVKPAGQNHYLTEFELTKFEYDIASEKMPLTWTNDMPLSGSFSAITLDDDEYFVLSDDRTGCMDSRYWGPVHLSGIIGRLVFQVFPFSCIGFVK